MALLSRRDVLRLAATLGLLPLGGASAGCGNVAAADGLPDYQYDGEPGPATLFAHAVASGDPLADAVILWTRLSPVAAGAIPVFWEVANDAGFTDRVAAGWTGTDIGLDYTVKIDATGLAGGRTYYYRFQALGRISPIGRTRTAPRDHVERMRVGVVSCSSYSNGYFHAYRRLAERSDLDLVIHLGDYIYEYGTGGERAHDPPHEIVTLADYRRRYAQYRSDPDLQAAHIQHPWVLVWDDHETANNAWHGGAENHQESEGAWADRRATAAQAYSEWLPIRDQDDGRIFRSLRFGNLLDLTMLDTRLWGRDLPAARSTQVNVIRDPGRTLLGFDQEEWLADQVRASDARWFVLGQQIVMTQWKLEGLPNSQGGGRIANTDQWDGYHATRERLFDALEEAGRDNLIVLTGDVHSSWASDLCRDPNDPAHYDQGTGAGSLGVEMVAPGVTSNFPAVGIEVVFLSQNPALKYGETASRGYLLLDLDHERAQGEWYHFADVWDPAATERTGAVWATRSGANHLVAQTEVSLPPAGAPGPVPAA